MHVTRNHNRVQIHEDNTFFIQFLPKNILNVQDNLDGFVKMKEILAGFAKLANEG
jgi:hypothetical protein